VRLHGATRRLRCVGGQHELACDIAVRHVDGERERLLRLQVRKLRVRERNHLIRLDRLELLLLIFDHPDFARGEIAKAHGNRRGDVRCLPDRVADLLRSVEFRTPHELEHERQQMVFDLDIGWQQANHDLRLIDHDRRRRVGPWCVRRAHRACSADRVANRRLDRWARRDVYITVFVGCRALLFPRRPHRAE
jgi:hypothetical protein